MKNFKPLASCGINKQHKNILVSTKNNDNATVYKLSDEEALVQSVNYIKPLVDNPYIYGKIAAAHSMSNIFAMGAEVKTAQNIIGFDSQNHSQKFFDEMLKGGNEKLKECGGLLMGGHTLSTNETFYGLCVTGLVHPQKIYRNNSAKIGHVLVLTKPLGIGILTHAHNNNLISYSELNEAIKLMETLNYLPSKIMQNFDVSACTSVSHLGLLRDALTSTNAFTSYTIHCGEVPVIPLAQELADQKVYPQQTEENFNCIDNYLTIMCSTSKCKLMYSDTQISGGLLIAMNANDAKEYIKTIEEMTFGYAKIIGEVIPRGLTPLIVY